MKSNSIRSGSILRAAKNAFYLWMIDIIGAFCPNPMDSICISDGSE